jgi:hypothetical protein
VQVAYFTTKDFERTLKAAFLSGGQTQKIAVKAKAILGSLGDPNPFHGTPVTNHGENRIPNLAITLMLIDGLTVILIKNSALNMVGLF